MQIAAFKKMEIKNYNSYFFLFTLIGVSIVTFFIFKPFLVAILLAAILTVIFHRPYRYFLKITKWHKRISAFLTSLFAILVFVGLFAGIVALIANETSNLLQSANSQGDLFEKYIEPAIKSVNSNSLLNSLGIKAVINKDSIVNSISQISQGTLSLVQKTYQSIAHFIFMAFIMFFTMYYFLIGGKDLLKKIMYLSPLKDSHEKILIEKFISISRATVKGTLVVAFVQGGIGGITFAIAGVPSATVWAVVMMFLSLIPMVGSSLVWFPVALVMLLTGNIWQGALILTVGLGIISLIDNFLRPGLVGKDIQMHPLVVFFATLGGISMFGFLGFIIGPIIVALFLSLWDIYAVEFKSQLNKFNA